MNGEMITESIDGLVGVEVVMSTQDMADDHNKLVSQYYELLAKYNILLAKCATKGIK